MYSKYKLSNTESSSQSQMLALLRGIVAEIENFEQMLREARIQLFQLLSKHNDQLSSLVVRGLAQIGEILKLRDQLYAAYEQGHATLVDWLTVTQANYQILVDILAVEESGEFESTPVGGSASRAVLRKNEKILTNLNRVTLIQTTVKRRFLNGEHMVEINNWLARYTLFAQVLGTRADGFGDEIAYRARLLIAVDPATAQSLTDDVDSLRQMTVPNTATTPIATQTSVDQSSLGTDAAAAAAAVPQQQPFESAEQLADFENNIVRRMKQFYAERYESMRREIESAMNVKIANLVTEPNYQKNQSRLELLLITLQNDLKNATSEIQFLRELVEKNDSKINKALAFSNSDTSNRIKSLETSISDLEETLGDYARLASLTALKQNINNIEQVVDTNATAISRLSEILESNRTY